MTDFTAFSAPLARRGLRRGARPPQAGRNDASGAENAAFGGSNRLPGCVRLLARCPGIAPRSLPDRNADLTHEMGHYHRSLV